MSIHNTCDLLISRVGFVMVCWSFMSSSLELELILDKGECNLMFQE